MNLQIEKLVVWSMDGTKRNEVNFKLDCVNVLSGESRTGKSAVASIIDYCLGSHDCSIPIGRVRENVSWFGIVVRVNGRRILLARQNPMEQSSTNNSVIQELSDDEELPGSIVEHTHSCKEVKELLNNECGITDVERGGYGNTDNQRLSYRDAVHLLFQVQDIIANRYLLFYKMQKAEVLEKFENWFCFIIGAETLADVLNRKELKDVENQLKQIESENAKVSRKLLTWYEKLRAALMQAKGFGFLGDHEEIPEDNTSLIREAKALVKQRKELMKSIRMNDSLSEDIRRLQAEVETESLIVDQLDHEVAAFKDLEDAVENQGSSTRLLRDRLSIAGWLEANAKAEHGICPVCGESGHTEASAEINKIIAVVKSCEDAIQGADKFPTATVREMTDKKKAKKEAHAKLESLNAQLGEAIKLQNEASADLIESTNQAATMFNTIELILELNAKEKAVDTDERLAELKRKKTELDSMIDKDAISEREKQRLAKIGELALARLDTLDSEEQYRQYAPVFKKADMNIVIKDAKNKEHTLGEVGSASNWLALHIAVTCAFQEFFASMQNPASFVPNFMVYDQPSQVYFPSDRPTMRDGEVSVVDRHVLQDSDRAAVRKVFQTLATSIAETKAANNGRTWQAIVLEHAGRDVYEDIDGVNVLEEWRGGKALIPHDWYETQQA